MPRNGRCEATAHRIWPQLSYPFEVLAYQESRTGGNACDNSMSSLFRNVPRFASIEMSLWLPAKRNHPLDPYFPTPPFPSYLECVCRVPEVVKGARFWRGVANP